MAKKKPRGRPSKFSQAKADEICRRMAEGETLRGVCKDDHMPSAGTVIGWTVGRTAAHKRFSEQYTRAREALMEYWAHEIVEISDTGENDTYVDAKGNDRVNHDVIQRSKLRVDTRRWLMSKLAPKKYGDLVRQEISGPDGAPLQTQHVDAPPQETREQWEERIKKQFTVIEGGKDGGVGSSDRATS